MKNKNVTAWLFCLAGLLVSGITAAKIDPLGDTEIPLPKAFGGPGNVSVSPSLGAVSDSIAIELAPGRRGIKPRLGLSYSSMASNGVVGLGWSLGTGRIERWRGDGVPSIVSTISGGQDNRYSYSLGGAGGELHDTNNDGTWRARIESVYRPFQQSGAGWSMADGGGVTYSFGSTSNSRIDGELWLLDQIEDASGNTATYVYGTECQLKPSNVPCADPGNQRRYLKAIHYTGFAPTNDLGANQVTFEYEYRPDRKVSYQRGVRESQNLRLRQISVRAQGDLVRRYRLSYSRYAGGPSLLASVRLIGADDVSEVTLRTLEYGERPAGWSSTANGSIPSDLALAKEDGTGTGVQFLDVNGDGLADAVKNGQTVYLGNGQGGFSLSTTWTNSIAAAQVTFRNADGIDLGIRLLDVNADGRPDIFIASPSRTEIWLNTGSGWAFNSNWTSSLTGLSGLNISLTDPSATTNCLAPHCSEFGANPPAGCSPVHCTGNEETDPDDCILPHSDPDQIAHCAIPDFNVPSTEPFAIVGSDGQSRGVEFVDVNADGRIDMVWSMKFDQSVFLFEIPRIVRAVFLNGGDENPGWYVNDSLANELAGVLTNDGNAAGAFVEENAYQGYSFSDVNGDGFPDIVRSIQGKQAVYLRNGSGWSFDSGYTLSMIANGIFSITTDFKSQGLMPLDFNDDGLIDYVRSNGENFAAFVNTGSGWTAFSTVALSTAQLFASNGIAFASPDGKGSGTSLSDVDGDGVIDVVTAKVGDQSRILLSGTTRSGRLVRSTNTLGEITEIDWTVSTKFNNTTPSGIQGLPFAIPLVERISRFDGRGGSVATTYDYVGGKYIGQGFRGFATIDKTPSIGLRTVTKYYQDEERANQPFEIRAYDSDNDLRAVSVSETIIVNAEPGVKQRLLKNTSTQRIDKDGTATSSFTDRTYDDRMQLISIFNDDDVGPIEDNRTSEFSWVRNDAAGIWSLMSRSAEYDYSGELMMKTIMLYDDLPEGYAQRGLPTTTREWVESDDYLTRSMSYDNFGNITRVVDRSGRAMSFTYDLATASFRTTATDDLGRTNRSEYDYRFGTLLRDVDRSGNETVTTSDAFGRTVRVVQPGDETSPFGTVTFQYSPVGNPQQQSYAVLLTENAGTSDVFETTYYFDAAGKVYESREEGPEGVPVITSFEFGDDGQPLASSMPYFEGASPRFMTSERDDLGRVVSLTDPLGQQVRMSYSGHRLDVENARGNVTSVLSNPNGDPLTVSLSVGGVPQTTRYEYDVLGRMTRLVDALGNETRVSFDGAGRRTQLDDPNAGVFNYRYDGEGRLIEQVLPDGKSILFVYSAAGELIEKKLPDGTSQTFVYGTNATPNAVGLLVEVRDAAGVMYITYDERARPVTKRRQVDGRTYLTAFSYDSMNRVRRVTYPDGFQVYYEYDSGNNLVAVTDKNGQTIADGFQYNAAKRITAFDYGNGVKADYAYDDLDRMVYTRSSTASGLDLQELHYVFDSANNVLAMSDQITGMTQSFDYDEANRLVRAVGSYGEEHYEYDAIGNLLQKGDMRFAVDPMHPQRVSCAVQIGKTRGAGKRNSSAIDPCIATFAGVSPNEVERAFALKYDARGNVTKKGKQGFAYNSENQLIQVRADNGRVIETNRYDSSGELIVRHTPNEKTVFIDGLYEEGKTHVSRHVKAGPLLLATVVTPRAHVELVAEVESPKDKLASIGILPGLAMLLLLIGLERRYFRRMYHGLAVTAELSRRNPMGVALIFFMFVSSVHQPVYAGPKNDGDAEKRFYYHANHLGSVNVVTNDEGEVTARRDYRPYGDPHEWSGANAGPRELLQTYQGQQFDDNTGLYYFKARYYDSELGRFLSADTVVTESRDPRTLNRYAFAGGNPVLFIDPTGRDFFSDVGDFFTEDIPGALSDAATWVEDNALEILTVFVFFTVTAILVVGTLATGGLLSFALAGALVGFATFGGIALAQGNNVLSTEFWQAAATGAVLGALVGVAFGAALPASLTGIGALGPITSGALLGAAAGGLEAAVACATGCGGVENLLLPVAQGIIIGGLVGAIGGAAAGRLAAGGKLGKASSGLLKVTKTFLNPGVKGFAAKMIYTTYSGAGGPGLSGRRTIVGDVIRVGQSVFDNKSLEDLEKPDTNPYFFGLLDDADTGLTTSPTGP